VNDRSTGELRFFKRPFRIGCILGWKAPRGGTTVELRLFGNDDQS
jgi:hypothetical protein